MRSANISGTRIKQAREERGLDQVDLAVALSVEHKLKIDQSDISEIERGIRGVKDYELDAIARVLDVSTVWLLRGKEKDE
jgi:transcriptional regulator with XRE-family HTH domain